MIAAPAQIAPRPPTGPWSVNYDTAQCVASRNYGTDTKPRFLVLKPSPNGGVMRLILIRKGSPPVAQAPASVQLGAHEPVKTSLLRYSDEKDRHEVVSINVPMNQFKAKANSTVISVRSLYANESFAVTSLPGVVAELEKCLADLQQFWNIAEDRAARLKQSAKAVRPLAELFSANDYPSIALAEDQQGKVGLLFLVDEQGRIADCSVEQTSNVQVLDTMSCYVLRTKARFTPAIGPDGKPARSSYTIRIGWRIAG